MPKFSPDPRKSRDLTQPQKSKRSALNAPQVVVPGPVPAQLNLKFEHEDDVVESFKPARDRGTLDLETLQEKLSSFIEAYCSVTPTAKTSSPVGRHGLKAVKGSRDRSDEDLIRPDPATHGRMRLNGRKLSSERFNPASTSPEQSSYERFLHRLGLKVNRKHIALDRWPLRHDPAGDEFEVKRQTTQVFVDHTTLTRAQMDYLRMHGITVMVTSPKSPRRGG